METKRCSKCGEIKPSDCFYRNCSRKDGLQIWCKSCQNMAKQKWCDENRIRARQIWNASNHRRGVCKPLGTNPMCAPYLGVYVAERVLSHVYQKVERASYGNPGWDFKCGKGYLIDVKASCRHHQNSKSDRWEFHTNNNFIADYFLCLAFDNRTHLNPEHVWLIPRDVTKDRGRSISISESMLEKWAEYELHDKLNQVVTCCDSLRGESI